MSDIAELVAMVTHRDNMSTDIRRLSAAFSWRALADNGLRFEVMARFRADSDSTLSEAKAAVDDYIATLLANVEV